MAGGWDMWEIPGGGLFVGFLVDAWQFARGVRLGRAKRRAEVGCPRDRWAAAMVLLDHGEVSQGVDVLFGLRWSDGVTVALRNGIFTEGLEMDPFLKEKVLFESEDRLDIHDMYQ